MKRQIILFFQKPDTEEHDDILPLVPCTLLRNKLLTPAVLEFLKKEVDYTFKTKHVFRKPKNTTELAEFLTTLRSLLPVDLYFALKVNGNIWHVDNSDTEKYQESIQIL
jgi:hypothetical protein